MTETNQKFSFYAQDNKVQYYISTSSGWTSCCLFLCLSMCLCVCFTAKSPVLKSPASCKSGQVVFTETVFTRGRLTCVIFWTAALKYKSPAVAREGSPYCIVLPDPGYIQSVVYLFNIEIATWIGRTGELHEVMLVFDSIYHGACLFITIFYQSRFTVMLSPAAATHSLVVYINRPRGIKGRVVKDRNRHTIGTAYRLQYKQGCRGYGDSHGDSHGYGYGMGMGTVMNPHGFCG